MLRTYSRKVNQHRAGLDLFKECVPGVSSATLTLGEDCDPTEILASICIALATALCFVAPIYSLWMLPFNRTAMLWHFWLATIGIAVFWFSFSQVGSALPNSRTAVWAVFVSAAVVLLTQILFVWNLLQAIFKMSRLQS